MILLDTNIVSESWRQSPSPVVVAWLDNQPMETLYLCAPVVAELRFGAERLAAGFRRDRLLARIELLENEGFQGRILDFDLAAAAAFGRIGAERERIGRRMEPFDAMIAAIAISRGMQMATRDTGDFADIGLDLINPFDAVAGY